MSSCRNALEELVIEEAEAQYKRLGADVKKRVDLSEVIAYTLNRLPPMYATTQRGWVQQRKKADQELGAAIAKTVRNGFLSTQSDVLRQNDPIPDHELISQARSLFKLRKLFSKDYLKWKDVPEIVRDALDSGYYQSLSSGTYVSLDRRNSLLARSYAVRRKTTKIVQNTSSSTKTEKDISAEIKDFESYMSGTIYRYSNILESLVTAIVERRVNRLDEGVQQKINIDDVAAYVLNRLPPMYATSRRGLQNLRQRVKSEMTSQIISIVKEALNRVVQSPERALSPLPFEKFNIELEDALVQLRELLKRNDVTWRNVAEVVEECLRAPRSDYPVWRAKHDV
ncbi:late competence development ComFB family protein [Pseudanabaena galeata UHCC 0370]|uniref:Late competence development ComFB family protein n=1 Tax=Pseudanabaena galeata UHCC 0370 TaxID=3110310 RepID=A0ABU5TL89_9CYAN|nr:late competence development ComFB family protein [Pseudanabaena galeata]MEA5479066.1 late competence development ComFB family protein [Pseudanabaena galeata UHCC 0370]